MRKHEVALRKAAGAGGHTSEKPESVTLPGFPWRSEGGYAEISHVNDNIVPFVRRVNSRRQAGVLVTGLEPARACAQRCERTPRLPVSPHQHLVGYEPRQSRRPRRDTSHVLPPATATVRAHPHECGTKNTRAGPQARAY